MSHKKNNRVLCVLERERESIKCIYLIFHRLSNPTHTHTHNGNEQTVGKESKREEKKKSERVPSSLLVIACYNV